MKKDRLLKHGNSIIRVLETEDEKILIIDCIKRTMPRWISISDVAISEECTENELQEATNMNLADVENIDAERRKIALQHYALISGILPFIKDVKKRSDLIAKIAENKHVSTKTIRNYLCLYLVYQNISALAPKQRKQKKLTKDEKNMRWALNKFFYNKNRNSIATTYMLMLKEKYRDSYGVLLPEYPTIDQFKYFYRKTKNMQNYYISRDGLSNYQRNNRPLLGDGVQEFAPYIGIGMLDATICDIYLVNEANNLVGRPILTACVDAYSGLCCGYSLSWEGGVYSLRNLMLNVITDKVEWCRKFGISITKEEWNCNRLPATLVTDMGSEYKSENFEQITELGVSLTNLPPYRPELKGSVEKFFDLIQESYKKYLKGKGVIEPDFQERGVRDYRKDACLTMTDFEKIILHCIIYYNSKRIIERFPYTKEMLTDNVQPFSSEIWNWQLSNGVSNLIKVDNNTLIYTLLPRTVGKFGRNGLKVNNLRYKCDGFTEMYLKGGTATVAYNPDDVSEVWLIQKGQYIRFELIENRFKNMELSEVDYMKSVQKDIMKSVSIINRQAQIDLAEHIGVIASTKRNNADTNIKNIRNTRKREQAKAHINFMEKVGTANE